MSVVGDPLIYTRTYTCEMHISLAFTVSHYMERSRMEKYGALGTCSGAQKEKIN